MTIHDAIIAGRNALIKKFTETEFIKSIIEKYAIEELRHTNEVAAEIATDVIKGKNIISFSTAAEFDKLWLWFFINYPDERT